MSDGKMRSHSPKGRRFYARPSASEAPASSSASSFKCDPALLARSVRESAVGADVTFSGPFGPRNVLYLDHVASGRAVGFVEDFVREQVLPFYGNTHTTTTVTSLQTTHFRDEARDVVRNAVNAAEDDAVIFVGAGATGAVHKLAQGIRPRIALSRRTVVFASVMEHHSSLLPWRDLAGVNEVILVPEDDFGRLDIGFLERELDTIRREEEETGSSPALLIGVFCAASNVTGVLNDDLAVTAALHRRGALAFWDYAAAAPHVAVDANPSVPGEDSGLLAKDALYFSTHKFVGGVQAPGVLVAKKKLFCNSVPNGGGGGSVFFVKPSDHRYLKDVETREEGGTPAIVETIRGGLAMQLKEAVGSEYIMTREEELWGKAKTWIQDRCPNLVLLGSPHVERLPVLSFLVRHPGATATATAGSTFLHYNFVCAVLNDLFGVQARGGCACAGPYAQSLLGMDEALAADFESVLAEDDRLDRRHLRRGHAEYSQYEILRPGFTRLNLPWFSSDEEVDFALECLELVSEHAWKLLPQYRLNNETGEWKHHSNLEYRERKWLGNISYGQDGKFSFTDRHALPPGSGPSHKEILSAARSAFDESKREAARQQIPDQRVVFEEVERLRWFLLPSEAKEQLCGGVGGSKISHSTVVAASPPFTPRLYPVPTPSTTGGKTSRAGSYWGKVAYSSSSLIEALAGGGGGGVPTSRKGSSWLDFTPSEKNLSAETKPDSEASSSACVDGACLPAPKTRPPLQQPPPKGEDKMSDEKTKGVKNKSGWKSPDKEIFRPFLEAVEEFGMVKDGDKILVCLSGGKDSLTLLHTMRQYQFVARKQGVSFDLGAVTVDPRSSGYDPRPLVPYLADLGVHYLYEEQDIMAQAQEAQCTSICAFCSRMKRGRIYAAARREGYNVLAMGQHLDDLAESFLMSTFHNGRLRTMKANYTVKEGDLRVIRPFCFVREKLLRDFATSMRLPVIAENCPACFQSPKERHRTKQLLAQQELLFPRLYWSLKSAMMPVMSVDRTGVESKLFGRQGGGLSNGGGGGVDGGDDEEDEDEL